VVLLNSNVEEFEENIAGAVRVMNDERTNELSGRTLRSMEGCGGDEFVEAVCVV
jgi:hypothetical protein